MAAVDYFLKVSGIDGESQDSKHKGEIDVLSWSWGVSQTGTHAAGGGGGAGKVAFQDFSIIKIVDKASPQLMQACCTGQHIPDANFTGRKAGGDEFEYLKIKLTDVLISSVQPSGSAGDQLALEQVSFSFGGSSISTFQQDPKGGLGGSETAVLCGSSKGRV
jgi:type VI secretion system secreted protein Hcp